MSDSFHDREQSFEAKLKLDEELKFKAEAHRNKHVGLWAAEKMGIEGADADAYAKSVVVSDMNEPGIEDVIRKVMGDFSERGLNISEDDLRAEMDRQMVIAIDEVKEDFEPLGEDHGG